MAAEWVIGVVGLDAGLGCRGGQLAVDGDLRGGIGGIGVGHGFGDGFVVAIHIGAEGSGVAEKINGAESRSQKPELRRNPKTRQLRFLNRIGGWGGGVGSGIKEGGTGLPDIAGRIHFIEHLRLGDAVGADKVE